MLGTDAPGARAIIKLLPQSWLFQPLRAAPSGSAGTGVTQSQV